MKAIVLILVLVFAAVLAHNYIQTGEVGFNVSLSEEKREIRRLEERLSDASRSYRIAARPTTVGGMAPDVGVETAAAEVREVERAIRDLRERIREGDEEYSELLALERKLQATKREIGIP